MLTAVANAAACSNASLKGIYGIWITGYDSSGAYQQSVSQIDSNGKGTFTGTETESDAGTIYNDVAITGTYSIAADCTGSGTIINPKNGNEAHIALGHHLETSARRARGKIDSDSALQKPTKKSVAVLFFENLIV